MTARMHAYCSSQDVREAAERSIVVVPGCRPGRKVLPQLHQTEAAAAAATSPTLTLLPSTLLASGSILSVTSRARRFHVSAVPTTAGANAKGARATVVYRAPVVGYSVASATVVHVLTHVYY